MDNNQHREMSYIEIIKEPEKWYHCNHENFKKDRLVSTTIVWFVLALLFLGLVLIWENSKNADLITQCLGIVCIYFTILFFQLAIAFFYIISYVYGKYLARKVAITLFYIITFFTVVSLIPFLLAWKLLSLIVSCGAKTEENLIRVAIMVAVDAVVINIVSYIISNSDKFEKVMGGINLNENAFILALFLLFTELGTVIANVILLRLFNSKNTNIEERAYNMRYQTHTIRKVKLFGLILLFFYATFSNNPAVIPARSDLINVISCATLIILFLDKRKEFLKNIKRGEEMTQ